MFSFELFFFNPIVIASTIGEANCVFVCSFLPSDSPPCSLRGPTGAAAPPRRSSEVGPAPDLRQHEEMRMTLAKEARSSLRGEHAKRANDVETWDVLQRTHGSGVLIGPLCSKWSRRLQHRHKVWHLTIKNWLVHLKPLVLPGHNGVSLSRCPVF